MATDPNLLVQRQRHLELAPLDGGAPRAAGLSSAPEGADHERAVSSRRGFLTQRHLRRRPRLPLSSSKERAGRTRVMSAARSPRESYMPSVASRGEPPRHRGRQLRKCSSEPKFALQINSWRYAGCASTPSATAPAPPRVRAPPGRSRRRRNKGARGEVTRLLEHHTAARRTRSCCGAPRPGSRRAAMGLEEELRRAFWVAE